VLSTTLANDSPQFCAHTTSLSSKQCKLRQITPCSVHQHAHLTCPSAAMTAVLRKSRHHTGCGCSGRARLFGGLASCSCHESVNECYLQSAPRGNAEERVASRGAQQRRPPRCDGAVCCRPWILSSRMQQPALRATSHRRLSRRHRAGPTNVGVARRTAAGTSSPATRAAATTRPATCLS
jgi:hypothetical protein